MEGPEEDGLEFCNSVFTLENPHRRVECCCCWNGSEGARVKLELGSALSICAKVGSGGDWRPCLQNTDSGAERALVSPSMKAVSVGGDAARTCWCDRYDCFTFDRRGGD